MRVVIRDDDTSFFTSPEELKRAYDFLKIEDCVSISIVPYTVSVHKDNVFPYGESIIKGFYDISENKELVEFLKKEKDKGRVDFLLHGYSHEYIFFKGKWVAEMLWKNKKQLSKEISKGKKHLERLLDCSISIFVAPNNKINKNGISVVEELGMNYSGIIGINDREINFRYIKNFVKRWYFRIIKKIQYPGILDYGKHKELTAFAIDNYENLIYKYKICKEKNIPFVVYTHYWQLNKDPKKKEQLVKLYNYIKKDGAIVAPLSECFR